MNPGYHLLQFVPDPFIETAITFGALVEMGPRWHFEAAKPRERLLPPAVAPATATLFRALLGELSGLTTPRLPITIGPHVRLGERLEIPRGVDDPSLWVSTHVLPTEAPAATRERRHQRTRRATMGKMFLKRYRMHKFVRSYFKPEDVGAAPKLVRPVSHYVAGPRETLLLEPVYLDSDRFDEDLQDVAGTLLAWQSLARQKKRENLVFSVYALGTSAEHLRLLRNGFSEGPVRVVDTDREQERAGLFQLIRVTSAAAELH